jgi:hypothetical protein
MPDRSASRTGWSGAVRNGPLLPPRHEKSRSRPCAVPSSATPMSNVPPTRLANPANVLSDHVFELAILLLQPHVPSDRRLELEPLVLALGDERFKRRKPALRPGERARMGRGREGRPVARANPSPPPLVQTAAIASRIWELVDLNPSPRDTATHTCSSVAPKFERTTSMIAASISAGGSESGFRRLDRSGRASISQLRRDDPGWTGSRHRRTAFPPEPICRSHARPPPGSGRPRA